MEKTIDVSQIVINGLISYLTIHKSIFLFNNHFFENYSYLINLIPAAFGFMWVFIQRLPKIVFYINKTVIGIKATRNGTELKKEDYLNNEESENEK